ncbi:hypothetical protein L873DRAFT_1798985 [Choiromyces venosus 120613-1]|uniref:Uncharacterized protein n=1 Tax=Choiromyces venosus 120613-1 TaxID=1336337 RepID=A0A3N4KFG3_9PEZI|nr:hypothetical protein L873DRAFT_1798985 [Choiromyces venosus 120613-1]
MANLQQPNTQNMSGAVHNVSDGCHNLSTKAAQIEMLQQLLNMQQELREQVRQLRSQQQRLFMMLYNTQNMLGVACNTAEGYQDLATEETQIQNMPAFTHGVQMLQMFQQFWNGQQELRGLFRQLEGQFIQIHDQFAPIQGQVVQQDQCVQVRDQFIQIQDQVAQIQDRVMHIRDQARELQNRYQHLNMMFYNTSASNLAPLRYPAGIPINNLPANCPELTTFTGPRLQAAEEVLELPVLSELFDSLSMM